MSRLLLELRGIALTAGQKLPILFLVNPDSGRAVPVPAGPAEANSIILQMEGHLPKQPLTHDLFAGFLQRHGFHLRCVEIYCVTDNEPLSRIHYAHGFCSYSMEARPSDAIALALRLAAPIYVSPTAFTKLAAPTAGLGETVETSDFLHLNGASSGVAAGA